MFYILLVLLLLEVILTNTEKFLKIRFRKGCEMNRSGTHRLAFQGVIDIKY